MDEYLAVGKLRRAHGVRGDIQLQALTDFPERIKPGLTLYLGENHQPLRLLRVRLHDKLLIVRLDGYTSPEQVAELSNQIVFVRQADLPALPEGEYYHHQLLGLRVIGDDGRELGEVFDILETGANDVLAVRLPSGKELLTPYHDDFVRRVDLEAGLITLHLIPGMLDEEA